MAFYNIEENKITFYKLSWAFKCLIASVFFIAFLPFIVWLFISKTLMQKMIMFFAVFLFVFILPLTVLLSNKKVEISKDEGLVRIIFYFYKCLKTKSIKFSEIEGIYIKPVVKRGSNYTKKLWWVYLKKTDKKSIDLCYSLSENEAKEVSVEAGKILNKDMINEESNETLDYKLFEADKLYIEKITQKEEILKHIEKPKNLYKDDYGKRVIYRWYNIRAFEFTLMFLIFYLLIFLNILLFIKKSLIFSTSLKLVLLFMVYFVLRYVWLVFIAKGWCELNKENIIIRKNMFLLPRLISIAWTEIKDVYIESAYYPSLVFKTKDKLLSFYMPKDKSYWLKNEINNYIKSHF